MTSETAQYQSLIVARMAIVQKLTDLNARHLKTETRLAGIDFELARCTNAEQAGNAAAGEPAGNLTAEAKQLEAERLHIHSIRAEIDQARASLEDELQRADKQIESIAHPQNTEEKS